MNPVSGRNAVIAIAALCLAIVGCIDYLTGELSVFVLYAIPIAWVSWRVNFGWGLVLGVFSAVCWTLATLATGPNYQPHWIFWERVASFLTNISFVAYSFYRFRRARDARENRMHQLESILPICIACRRVRDSRGSWIELESYLKAESGTEAESCVCPDCLSARHH
jgi:hypothetical protein